MMNTKDTTQHTPTCILLGESVTLTGRISPYIRSTVHLCFKIDFNSQLYSLTSSVIICVCGATGTESALWMLMSCCYSTTASAAMINADQQLNTYMYASLSFNTICLWVDTLHWCHMRIFAGKIADNPAICSTAYTKKTLMLHITGTRVWSP